MSLAFVRESQHKRPVTWKMFPFDDIIMTLLIFMHMPSEIQILIHQGWLMHAGISKLDHEIKACRNAQLQAINWINVALL